jgi:predicted Zn-dependent protease with MMP-like domain
VQILPPEEFEQLVAEALDDLPPELAAQFRNVAVVVEDEHPEEPDLVGLYEGVPLTEREHYSGVLPDRIRVAANDTRAWATARARPGGAVGGRA